MNRCSGELAAIDRAHAVLRLHPNGEILDANDRFLSLFGFGRSELVGRDHAMLASSEDLDSGAYAAVWSALRQGEVLTQRCKRKTKTGRTVYLQASYTPVFDNAGRLTRILKLASDVTDSTLAEHALERARHELELQRHAAVEQLEGFFHSSLDALCLADRKGRIVRANTVMQELLGCTHALEDVRFLNLVHPADVRPTLRAMAALRSGGEVFNFTNRCRCPQGRYRLLEWRARTLGDLVYASAREREEDEDALHAARTAGAIVEAANRQLLRERSALHRRTEERVQHLQRQLADTQAEARAKAEFLANMSHELRTPLNAVIGYTELVREEISAQGENQAAADLERVLRAAEHLLKLINDVLDLSKAEAGKLVLRPGPCDVARAVEEVLEVCRPAAAARGNTMHARLGRLPEGVWLDDLRLRQCLINLVSNAARFTERGVVCVDGFWSAGVLTLRVSDTGVGIAPDVLETLFQAFAQGDCGRARPTGGTGLGLLITRRIAELMGGVVSVESTLGVGSTFTLQVAAPVLERERAATA